MPTRPKRALFVYVAQDKDNKNTFNVWYTPPNDPQPQLLHSLTEATQAHVYAEGIIDGINIARNLLHVSKSVGNNAG